MISNLTVFFTNLSQTIASLTQEEIIVLVINTVIGLFVLKVFGMIWRLSKNKFLGLTTKPYSSSERKERKILILGDSTAVGTGADNQADTIGGRLARDYPNSQIINVAKNGGLIADVYKQIEAVQNQNFDMIIVSTGGNDVWHYTNLVKIHNDLIKILPILGNMSNQRVIFLVYNNIGSAPIFPSLVQWFLKRRCLKVHRVISYACKISNVQTIELFNTDSENPFHDNPEELFATDGVHPSSAGYRLWYNRLWRQMTKYGHFY